MEIESWSEPNLESEVTLSENLHSASLFTPAVTPAAKKRNSYTLGFKRDVLRHLISQENMNIKSPITVTANQLNVNYTLAQKWSKERDNILDEGNSSILEKWDVVGKKI